MPQSTHLLFLGPQGALLNHILQHGGPLGGFGNEGKQLSGRALQILLPEDARLERAAGVVRVGEQSGGLVVERHCSSLPKRDNFLVLTSVVQAPPHHRHWHSSELLTSVIACTSQPCSAGAGRLSGWRPRAAAVHSASVTVGLQRDFGGLAASAAVRCPSARPSTT